MQAKGSFFVARRSYVCSAFGEAAWTALLRKMASIDPAFQAPILATSLLPIESYMRFQDELVAQLFAGDPQGYWIAGEKAGEWALQEGPYKTFRAAPNQLTTLVANLPKIWTAYFTEGTFTSRVVPRGVEIEIRALPVAHISLEYTVMGFAKAAIELCTGKPPTWACVEGISRGDREVFYRFVA